MSADLAVESRPRGSFRRLYYGQTRFDFVRRRRWWFLASSIIILAGIISLATRGLNFDIEFVGGTSWQVPSHGVSVQRARSALVPLGFGGATITLLGTGSNSSLQVEAKLAHGSSGVSSAEEAKVTDALAALTHSSAGSVSVQQVGPTWGSQITHKAVVALIVFFILIALYISLFFEWKMALAAIIAVLHDILVTLGIYSLTAFLVTPDTVVAFLTILGYSLYDTIVVFDRVRDNTKGIGATGKLTLTDVVNLSMNQTLARSINTSLVAILPILAVLLLGADLLGATTLEYFGLALLVGLASGAYSSIFIASPLLAVLKEREPRYSQIRQRLETRGAAFQLLSPAAVAGGVLEDREAPGTGTRRRRRSAQAVSSGPLRPGGRVAAGTATKAAPMPPSLEEGELELEEYETPEPEAEVPSRAPVPRPAVAGRSNGAGAGRPQRTGGQRPGGRAGGGGGGGPATRRPRKKRRR